jgi:methyl-accepting chemotaxis protein
MDEVTQQNAALVEEAAAAAESLEEQAVGLADAVSVFKMNEGGALAVRRQHAPAVRSAAARPAARSSMPAKVVKAPAPAKSGGAEEEWEEF